MERKHIMDMGLTLLSQATFPLNFWDEAFSTSVYLINRLPRPVLQNISPLEKLFGPKPNYPSLRTFGCKCYSYLRLYQSHKLSFRSQPCTFLVSISQLSRHVLFYEKNISFSLPLQNSNNCQLSTD